MQRRSFIQSFGILAGGMAISLKSKAFQNLQHGSEISGKVTCNEKPVSRAIVSDGFSVVATDKKGVYKIKLTDKSEFITLSTPAGYEFKIDEENLARQYEGLGAKNEYNFKLKSLNRNDDNHHFVIWADPQIKTKADVTQLMNTTVPDMKSLVQTLGSDVLIHGITVGDIAWDVLELFDDYSKAIEKINIPFFQCLGNHDQDYNQGGDESADKTFKSRFGPTYYSFNRGKAHYVVLDDVRYLGVDRKYDGYISQEQLNWLKKDLSFIGKDQLIIINVHIPIHNSVKNNQDFYDIIKDFNNVHVMSGHTHYNVNAIKGNVFEHNHGAVCGAWWTGGICPDGTPRGYGVYKVSGNQLSWFYKSTGHPKDKQMNIDLEPLTANNRIIVNVWNYDPEWDVSLFLDGKRVLMEKTKGFDPESVRLYQGPDKPKPRGFAEPKRTEHLFMAHFSSPVKEIKVIATDRFGIKYEEKKYI